MPGDSGQSREDHGVSSIDMHKVLDRVGKAGKSLSEEARQDLHISERNKGEPLEQKAQHRRAVEGLLDAVECLSTRQAALGRNRYQVVERQLVAVYSRIVEEVLDNPEQPLDLDLDAELLGHLPAKRHLDASSGESPE